MWNCIYQFKIIIVEPASLPHLMESRFLSLNMASRLFFLCFNCIGVQSVLGQPYTVKMCK